MSGLRPVNYESGLRVIGRHLDAALAACLVIWEDTEGLVIRYVGQGERDQEQTELFTWDRLSLLAVFNAGGRGVRAPRGVAGTYEDRLRSLGHQLDTRRLSDLHLEGTPGGFNVTASTDSGPISETFSTHDLDSLAEQARARRRHLRRVQ